MGQGFHLLIVSGSLKNKNTLMNIIGGLPLDVYTASTIAQAWEVLLDKPVEVILCDESLPDATYQDFLAAERAEYKLTRFVVLLRSDVWDEYLEAIRLGASDVIRCPYQPIDIELGILRAAHDVWQKEELRMRAST